MSYGNNYHQYSPYFQQGLRHDESRINSTYSPTSYQPPSPFQAQSQQPATRCNNISSTGYGNRSGYFSGRSSIDATKPGYLADGSSLSRSSKPSQQGGEYSANSNTYWLGAAGTASAGHERADSGGATASSRNDTSKIQPAVQPSRPSYQAPSTSVSQYLPPTFGSDAGRQTPMEPQYTATHASYEAYTTRRGGGELYPAHAPSTQYQRNPSPSDNAAAQGSHLSRRPRHSAAGFSQMGQNNTGGSERHGDDSTTYNSAQTQQEPWNPAQRPSNLTTQANDQRDQRPNSAERYHPTIVAPYQVFNHHEYQKTKDAEVERQRSEEAARLVQTATPSNQGDKRSQSVSSQPSDVLQAARAAIGDHTGVELVKKDQMELEIKQMIERMRDYKAKDPSLFSQLWEQVKKSQPLQISSPIPVAPGAAASPISPGSQLANPVPSELSLQPKLPVASSFPPDFDRSRFPYLRRRRGAIYAGSPSINPDTGKKSHQKLPPPGPETAPAFGTAPSPAAVAQISTNEVDSTNARLYTAMQHFNRSLVPPDPPPTQPDTNTINPHPQPTIQSAPAPNSIAATGKTHWPEQTKWSVAEAARLVLTSTPQNAGKQITAEEIQALLDQNPSYAQMCENIEGRGFIIDRRIFARFLLAAVPDMAPGRPPSAAVPSPVIAAPNPRSNGHASPYPLPPHFGHSGHYNYGKTPDRGQLSNPQRVFVSGKAFASPSVTHQYQPTTKGDKARKRSFSNIVGLTQALSDDEDFERHQPRPRADQVSNIRVLEPAKVKASKSGTSTPTGEQTSKADGSRSKPSGKDYILSERVVEFMNPKRDALRRSTYNPKTIARDILISSGRHPTMAPLNSHLEVLRERFVSVSHESDLSTFRWDIVDPDGQSSGEVEAPVRQVLEHDDSNKNAGDEDPAEGLPKSSPPKPIVFKPPSVKPSSSSPKPVEEDTAPEPRGWSRKYPSPEVKIVNRVPTTASTGKPPSKPIQSRLGRKAVAHGPKSAVPKPPVKANDLKASMKAQAMALEGPTTTQDPESRSALIDSFTFKPVATSRTSFTPAKAPTFSPKPVEQSTPKSPTTKSLSSARKAALSSPLPPPVNYPSRYDPRKEVVHGRKGRPPGSKNKHPRSDKGISKGPKVRSRAGSSAASQSIPMQPPQIDTPRSKKDVLCNAISLTNGLAVVIQSRSPSVGGTAHSAVKREDRKMAYKVYKCGWEDCPAELHNVETLRKHARKHRKGLDQPLPCKWAGCGTSVRDIEGLGSLMFQKETAWDRHVEKKHIRAVAIAQGDILSGDSDEDSSDRSASPDSSS